MQGEEGGGFSPFSSSPSRRVASLRPACACVPALRARSACRAFIATYMKDKHSRIPNIHLYNITI